MCVCVHDECMPRPPHRFELALHFGFCSITPPWYNSHTPAVSCGEERLRYEPTHTHIMSIMPSGSGLNIKTNERCDVEGKNFDQNLQIKYYATLKVIDESYKLTPLLLHIHHTCSAAAHDPICHHHQYRYSIYLSLSAPSLDYIFLFFSQFSCTGGSVLREMSNTNAPNTPSQRWVQLQNIEHWLITVSMENFLERRRAIRIELELILLSNKK